jgi:hypothetical protein
MMPELRFATVTIGPPQADVIENTAADLVRCSATNEAEAIRALVGKHPYGQIVAFADQALAVAQRRAGTR